MQSLGGIPTAKASVVVHSHKSEALLVTLCTQTAFDIHITVIVQGLVLHNRNLIHEHIRIFGDTIISNNH